MKSETVIGPNDDKVLKSKFSLTKGNAIRVDIAGLTVLFSRSAKHGNKFTMMQGPKDWDKEVSDSQIIIPGEGEAGKLILAES